MVNLFKTLLRLLTSWPALALGGMLAGLTLTVGIASLLLASPRQVSFTPSLASTPSPFPLPTPSPSPTPGLDLLSEARQALESGYPERVRDLLLPHLDDLQPGELRGEAYRLLGDAEVAQGRYKLACGYYEKAYNYQPNIENLFQLAVAYDAGGDLERAREKYALLLEYPDDEDYHTFAEERIEDIDEVLQYRTASP